MNDIERAIETMKGLTLCGSCTQGNCKECDRKNAKDMAIPALELVNLLGQSGFTTEVIKNYKIFEDEMISQGFTLASVLEAREKQIPKPVPETEKPDCEEDIKKYGENALFGCCPVCKEYESSLWNSKYCGKCGQALDWAKAESVVKDCDNCVCQTCIYKSECCEDCEGAINGCESHFEAEPFVQDAEGEKE